MDGKKAVVVLAPNGRRQTVKVTPNTSILQILEEVCKKQGLVPDEYDIKHHNKCLDTSTIIRFSGLPNNAQLELAEATKTRSESVITVGIQLENGTRLMGSFAPSISLWEVLTQLCPEETSLDNNAVVIYMRQEIYGKSKFESTTLRSLGLTSGRAMLRLIHRSPEELRTQANVSAPLPSKPVEEKPYVRTLKKIDVPSEPPVKKDVEELLPKPAKLDRPEEQTLEKSDKKQSNFLTQFIKQEKEKKTKSPDKDIAKPLVVQQSLESMDVDSEGITEHEREKTVAEEEFVFLGSRNAMIFSQEAAQAIPSEDLPDDFFELTITDAKKLLRDIKKSRSELENLPLQTNAYRNVQESTRQLSQLNRYKQSIIRVNFPDHTVLQGTFIPADTVSTVQEFVREYLEDKTMDFYLYTAPPKTILDVHSRLIEIGCVPNAILHFGAKVLSKDVTYLRTNLLSQFTTASIASLVAAKMRQQSTRPMSVSNIVEDMVLEDSDVNVGASTSSGVQHYEDYPDRAPQETSSETEKVPKWFKRNK